MLELAFADESLREVCSKKLAAESEYGVVVAKRLRSRIADLRAAENVADLVTGDARAHNDDEIIINIYKNWRLVFKANHPVNPMDKNNQID
jgi:plasmid maintenance system killer protein